MMQSCNDEAISVYSRVGIPLFLSCHFKQSQLADFAFVQETTKNTINTLKWVFNYHGSKGAQ